MLIGRIRQLETQRISAVAESVEEAHDAVVAQVPEGWELTDSPVTMAKASTTVTCEGVISRRGDVQEIEADSFDALRADVPEGWQLLSVRPE